MRSVLLCQWSLAPIFTRVFFFTPHTAVQAHKPLDPMIFIFDFPFQRVQVSCGMAAMENNVLYLASTNLIYFFFPFYTLGWYQNLVSKRVPAYWPPYSQGQSVDPSKTVSTDLPSCQHLRQFGLLSQVIPNSKFWQTNRLFNIFCSFRGWWHEFAHLSECIWTDHKNWHACI